jgi:hypothetical protein
LLSHACAANLRLKLKFADASVVTYPADKTRTKDYLAVTVIEPEDSGRVRYRVINGDSLPLRADWAPAIRIYNKYNYAVQNALQLGLLFDTPALHADSTTAMVSSFLKFGGTATGLAEIRRLKAFLHAHQGTADRKLAQQTLDADGDWQNRVIAALILASGANADDPWRAEVEALRDPDGRVSGAASQALNGLRKTDLHQVNWSPDAATVRLLLGGTNLFAHNNVMQLLAATRVAPSLAPALLAGNSSLILAKLASGGTAERSAAHAFLVQMASHDYGFEPEAWQPWLNSLQPAGQVSANGLEH